MSAFPATFSQHELNSGQPASTWSIWLQLGPDLGPTGHSLDPSWVQMRATSAQLRPARNAGISHMFFGSMEVRTWLSSLDIHHHVSIYNISQN